MATALSTLVAQTRKMLQEIPALVTPGSPLVSPQGTPGSSTISYKITATNALGESDASQAGTTTTAAGTLTGTNFNRLTWTAVPTASGYKIYRTATNGTAPTTTGLIGTSTTATFDDTGLAGDSATAPTANTSGVSEVFWTDSELLDLMIAGCRDLWRAFLDLHQEHFFTNDASNVSLAASTGALTGVPSDVFRILSIEPRDLTSTSSGSQVVFTPCDYYDPRFREARSWSALAPGSGGQVFYTIVTAGAPVGAPSILTAPELTSALSLRLVYIQTLGTLTAASTNPIPGESDFALIAWTTAYARAKERGDLSPDPAWLAVYATEKQSVLTVSVPRQEQEEQYAEGLFEGWI